MYFMRIGIICAIPNELQYFNYSKNPFQKIGERKFYTGTQDKHELILVQSGIGKVNAAVVSTLLIEKFECDCLLFSGVAGGIDPGIRIGEIIIADSLIQYDYGKLKNGEILSFRPGRIPIGKANNKLEYYLDPKIKTKIKASIPNIRMGKILTGDLFLQCEETQKELFRKYGAQAIDMEGAAIAQVAEQFRIPAVVVRCLSDLVCADNHKHSSKFLNKAAKRSSDTAQKILNIL